MSSSPKKQIKVQEWVVRFDGQIKNKVKLIEHEISENESKENIPDK